MTGLTEHQNKLLHLFFQGKTDADIQTELGIGSASTIRQHRFALKEKEGYFDEKKELEILEQKWLNNLQPFEERGYNRMK